MIFQSAQVKAENDTMTVSSNPSICQPSDPSHPQLKLPWSSSTLPPTSLNSSPESQTGTAVAVESHYAQSNYQSTPKTLTYHQFSEQDAHSNLPAVHFNSYDTDMMQSVLPFLSPQFGDFDQQTYGENQPLFFDDVRGSASGSQSFTPNVCSVPDYVYSSQATQVLGAIGTERCTHPSSIRRCFNCGEASHSLTNCPEHRNEPLIRLSRQMFQIQKTHKEEDEVNDSHLACTTSLSANVEETLLARRKSLASSYFPGQVSPALREALFWDSRFDCTDTRMMEPDLRMPWISRMEKWGVGSQRDLNFFLVYHS